MKEDNFEDFESLIDIDETILDRQISVQPKLVWRYGRMMAEATQKVDELKSDLEVIEAELDEEIRKNPSNFGMEKITETGIKNAIIRNDKASEAKKKLIEAKGEVSVIQAAVSALDHRRTSLSNFVTLMEQSYFSSPKKVNTDNGKDYSRRPLKRREKRQHDE